ncbi:MAG: hypothetical protein ACRCXC_04295 [Legionella sp.]
MTATLADSVAFAAVYDRNGKLAGVVSLNKIIHQPNAELERIQIAGGLIRNGRVNGSLAVSRAVGDFAYNSAVVCADVSIDIHRLEDIYASIGIEPDNVGTVQIITTCDGFTEPLGGTQTKEDQEWWLEKCLNEIPNASSLEEHEIAKMLAIKALIEKSTDNVSVAVQKISPDKPFMIGMYDGHGGSGASSYTVANIGDEFDHQCSLDNEAYAKRISTSEAKKDA